ncbi:MAG TPA: Txe/YoeB family addiction module toxin [Lentisphaeria bacterium]|nr:MAG: toxin of toxin-antitoxin system [Lentisphaerae bacterium GWF2_38_69]HBM15631.1 Txe/YoeB family addiction module toxin [Lentisphaeria bacterium]
MSWKIVFTKDAQKDFEKVKTSKYEAKVKELLHYLREDPYKIPPPFEKLVGSLHGFISRRINRKHRLVYQIIETQRTIMALSMWSHYGD